jgi:hypothetical protein
MQLRAEVIQNRCRQVGSTECILPLGLIHTESTWYQHVLQSVLFHKAIRIGVR